MEEMFPSIDEIQEMLEEIAEGVPEDFYRGLNAGIGLIEGEKYHKETDHLLILGEYEISCFGRGIKIYYGSMKLLLNGASRERIREQLEETLYHEFTHHLESLAGERGLEIKDKIQLKEFLNGDR